MESDLGLAMEERDKVEDLMQLQPKKPSMFKQAYSIKEAQQPNKVT